MKPNRLNRCIRHGNSCYNSGKLLVILLIAITMPDVIDLQASIPGVFTAQHVC
jgi:hypothetical protein